MEIKNDQIPKIPDQRLQITLQEDTLKNKKLSLNEKIIFEVLFRSCVLDGGKTSFWSVDLLAKTFSLPNPILHKTIKKLTKLKLIDSTKANGENYFVISAQKSQTAQLTLMKSLNSKGMEKLN